MTKRDIIIKWGGIIAAGWAAEEVGRPMRPTESTERYERFLAECMSAGYVNGCAEELWNKAITYAERLPVKTMHPLQLARLRAGLSQSQLAEISGVNIRMVQNYEQRVKDLRKASYDTVEALAEALNVDARTITSSAVRET